MCGCGTDTAVTALAHHLCVCAGVMHVIWPGVSLKRICVGTYHFIENRELSCTFILIIIQVLAAAKSSQYLVFCIFLLKSRLIPREPERDPASSLWNRYYKPQVR